MPDYLLLSIKSKWVKKILSGEKTWELRKNKPVMPEKLLIYEKTPRAALVVEAKIERIVSDVCLYDLWQMTEEGKLAQVTKVEFDRYYEGKDKGTAIIISNVKAIEPIPLIKLKQVWHPWHPPQGFQYISKLAYERAIAEI